METALKQKAPKMDNGSRNRESRTNANDFGRDKPNQFSRLARTVQPFLNSLNASLNRTWGLEYGV